MLVSLRKAELRFADRIILDAADADIEAGERICVVGRNGAGKSTLLSVLQGTLHLDDGTMVRAPDLRVASLPQELPKDALPGTVYDLVGRGLAEWRALNEAFGEAASAGRAQEMARLEAQIEAAGGWHLDNQIAATIDFLRLEPEATLAELSGGMQRRALLAAALVNSPQILLLDEPTNHLDVETIEWLEQTLLKWSGTLVFVSHDRKLVDSLSTRIIELDRGHLHSYPGDLAEFDRKQAQRLAVEARQEAEFDRTLANEESWIRQGIKARRTRNEGRVRRLEKLRTQRAARREKVGRSTGTVQAGERSGTRVFEASNICWSWGDTPLIDGFSTLIERGDRVGIVGANGSGKTTLLRLLLGELEPQTGTVRTGTRLETAFLDQHRAALDPDARVRDAIADGDDFIQVGDQRRHVIGYLQEFLFSPAQCNAKVRSLSGGERGRLNLARLFARPSNLLVLDEPTNDLDLETLELLEEQLSSYPGTVLLVSHDRALLDNVVTSLLVVAGDGEVSEFPGGYSDWAARRIPVRAEPATRATNATPRNRETRPQSRKLSYRDQRELDELPARIESLETQIASLQERLADPDLWRDDADTARTLGVELTQAEQAHALAFERWAELEAFGS